MPTREAIQCEDCGVYNDPIDTLMFQGEVAVCLDQKDCKTRQRLRSKDIIGNSIRRQMAQEETLDHDRHHKKAKELVAKNFNETFPIDTHTKAADASMFYVVMFGYVLGSWKALVSTDIISGQYWEVTYDANKKQSYVDHYFKQSNTCYSDEVYAFMS